MKNKRQTSLTIKISLILIILGMVTAGVFLLNSLDNTIEDVAPKEIFSIPIFPELQAVSRDNAFIFDVAKLYQFQSVDNENLEACLPMREWNINKAYYSCGGEGQTVFALESWYRNTTDQVQHVRAGMFRIVLGEGKYLNANFTSEQTIEIEPGVKYIYRIVFENIESIPQLFVVEYGDRGSYSGRLEFDLSKGVAKYLD